MATGSTARGSIPYPLSTDTANISSDIQSLSERLATIMPIWSSGSTRPASPANGQIWWNTNTNSTDPYGLNYYSTETSSWVPVGADIRIAASDPTPYLNLIVYRTDDRSLKYYNGTSWVNIIPATTTSGYVYVVDSTATGSNTSWKQLPTAGVKHFYNPSNATTIGTAQTAISFGTVTSVTGYTKYLIQVSFPVVITAAGATTLRSEVSQSGGSGTLTGGLYTPIPPTANNTVINVSYTALYTSTGSNTEGLTFGAVSRKEGGGTLTSYSATLTVTPLAF